MIPKNLPKQKGADLEIVEFPLATKGKEDLPIGFIADLKLVPRLTTDQDPQSGASRLKAPGPSCITQSIESLEANMAEKLWLLQMGYL